MLRHTLRVWALLIAGVATLQWGTEPVGGAEPTLLPAPANVARSGRSLELRCQSPDVSRPVRSRPAPKGFSLTRSVKSMFSKAGDALKPEPKVVPTNDPTRLATKVGPVGSEVYVAAGRLAEHRGNLDNAVAQYEKALEVNPADRNALITYGRLQRRRGLFADAEQLYRRAVQVRPDDAVAYNDLGLCLDKRGQLVPAIETLKTAVALAPDRKLYRNNLALVLTKAGRLEEAHAHLAHAHGEAIAHYNLGYLLYQDGKAEAAAAHVARSLDIDPTLQQARDMLHRMGYSRASSDAQSPQQTGTIPGGQSARRGVQPPPPTHAAAPPEAVSHVVPPDVPRDEPLPPPGQDRTQSVPAAADPSYGIRLPHGSVSPNPPNSGPTALRIPAPEPTGLGVDAHDAQRSGRFGFNGLPAAGNGPIAAPDERPRPEPAPPELDGPLDSARTDSEFAPQRRVDLQGNEDRHYNVARFPTIRIPSRRTPAPSRPGATAPVPEKIAPLPTNTEVPQFLPPVR